MRYRRAFTLVTEFVARGAVCSSIDIWQLNLPALPLRWKSRGAIIIRLPTTPMPQASEIPEIHQYLDNLRRKLKGVETVPLPAADDRKVAAVLVPLMHRNGGGFDVL